MSQSSFVPKLWSSLRAGYTRQMFLNDLLAGIIVGIVALPLAIAFGIASGVKPEQGLFTAIVAGFIISVLSGSRVQIGGPTGAFVVIVFDIIQKFGYDGLAIATLMAGALLIVMGLARMGSIIKFIPYPVTVGFTSGIALIIFAGQLRDFLGLQMDEVPSEFLDKLYAYEQHLNSVSWSATLIGLGTIAIILLWPKLTRRIPGSLIAILVTTTIVGLFDLPVATIGSRFGDVPNTLPLPQLPALPSWDRLSMLFSPALTIAILAGIESLLSAVVADGMTEGRHRSNMELIAQGAANMISPLFGGIPATGAIARTATNIKNGGHTPIAGIVHAITLLLILLFFGKWATMIPMPTLAGILIVVAWNMSELPLFLKLLKGPRGDILVLLSTFGLTVLIDLTVAIQVGMVLAAFLFMRRMAEATQVGFISRELNEIEEDLQADPKRLRDRHVPEGVEVFEINGPFFFGAADKFKNALGEISPPPKVLILRMRHALTLDATALKALESVYSRSKKTGTQLILSGVHAQPLIELQRSGFLNNIGEENVFDDIDSSLKRAREVLKY
ncbi:SulP family inorganic anion transporter [Malonomonas rubra]|uniref:SulP family inorganic anion transporter n=1 Tax=Malonomonas rubra TaxID=57040 RepID=UPI0026EBA763|nr:sulfate permease [Malonomonas rubra]